MVGNFISNTLNLPINFWDFHLCKNRFSSIWAHWIYRSLFIFHSKVLYIFLYKSNAFLIRLITRHWLGFVPLLMFSFKNHFFYINCLDICCYWIFFLTALIFQHFIFFFLINLTPFIAIPHFTVLCFSELYRYMFCFFFFPC